ncbi:MAG: DUF1579 domain-containing protein [Solirubrobacterales bacterium]
MSMTGTYTEAETRGQTQEQATMNAEPQAEHRWLQKLVGEWACEGEGVIEPGNPPVRFESTLTTRSIGELWIVAEDRGDMPGSGPSTTIMTLGYDPQKERFVGTFIGSMMTHLWQYSGELDATENVLTLETEGPSMSTEGKMERYKDVIEIKGDNRYVLSSYVRDENGNWWQFMTARCHREK